MTVRVIERKEMPIAHESDVAEVRGTIRELALRHKFDSFAVAALVTAASELTRNTWLHGHGGTVAIEQLADDDRRYGIRMCFADKGPGIAELERVLQGGYSTKRSLGLGLSGSRRLVDEFHIDTRLGQGTQVTVTKWKRL